MLLRKIITGNFFTNYLSFCSCSAFYEENMPPKKAEASKKTAEKQKQKIIEDKTFGLKNKKGAKQQKFIQHVQKQVTLGNKSAKDLERLEREKQEKKEGKKREISELNELFKPVAELQKCAKGVDPKSVLCVFFKQGLCTKGEKCKFSHDLNIERKGEKRGIYSEEDKVEESMENWDLDKLEEVVSRKHEATNKGLPPTTIVCKYFIEAVENFKYGWFWECPNGKTCHYRHALPSGFVLKRDQKKIDEQKEVISLDDLIERERLEKMEAGLSAKAKREADFKLGRTTGISGREIFEFNPNLVTESCEADEDDEGDVVYTRGAEAGEDEYNGPLREIDANTFLLKEEDVEDDATIVNGDQPQLIMSACAIPGLSKSLKGDIDNGIITVDEELFNEADLEDLENELDELEIEQ
ncbi:Zinc finger CCCH domain-containing protein 15 [Fasciola hepatica]|uniref:Zinc finger CCCH domain-containing protein 15 n=1 Tax=Fasciola hepatica TaxID=6192 RepID=A0A4E0RLH0_FASHE|nr:Zinc finger CCCH domain-containing protein 15 [Fasciola hepatica]